MSLKPGAYMSEIVAVGLSTATSGAPCVWITVAIDDGFGGAAEEMTGRIWLTQKAMGAAKKQLNAVGFNWQELDLSYDSVQTIVGNEVEVTLKEEEYKGRRDIKLTWFGEGNKPPTPEACSAATKLLRAGGKDKDGESQPVKRKEKPADEPKVNVPPPASREPGEDEGDDIPF